MAADRCPKASQPAGRRICHCILGLPRKAFGSSQQTSRTEPPWLRRSREFPERVYAEMFATIASSNDGPSHYTTQEPGTTTPFRPANFVQGLTPDSADDQQSMRYRAMIQGDVPRVTDLAVSCFGPDELWSWLYPYHDEHPDDLRRYMRLRVRQRLVEPGTCCIVAETEADDSKWGGSPEVVGFAFWIRNGKDEAAKKWRMDCLAHKVERLLLSTEGWYSERFLDQATAWDRVQIFHDSTAFEAFWNALDGETGSWHLAMLGVSAQRRRQGVGSSLVAWGKSRAQEEQVPVTLEASAMGRALYARLGFRIVQRSVICDRLDGVVMMWEPDGRRGKWLAFGEAQAEDAKLRSLLREG